MRIVLTIIRAMRTWTRRGFSLQAESQTDETLSLASGMPTKPQDTLNTTWRSLEGFAYSIAVGAFHREVNQPAERRELNEPAAHREVNQPAAKQQLAVHVVSDLATSSSDLALWLMTREQSNEAECVLRATVDDLEGVLAWAEGETRDACVEGLADAASELGFLLAAQGRKDEVAVLLTRCQRALVLEISRHEAT